MKKVSIIILTILLSSIAANTFARDILTRANIKVSGSCDMCKERIEKAANINGVKKAEWNEDTHILSVVFAPEKNNLDAIRQSIANAGYDTDKIKAKNDDYGKLPKCCQYDR